jgi:hypothetical protein
VPTLPDTAPSPPHLTRVVVLGGGKVKVIFKPGRNGGDKISGYLASCRPKAAGKARTATTKASPVVVRRLSRGKRYSCSVRARNDYGYGGPSTPSKTITVR